MQRMQPLLEFAKKSLEMEMARLTSESFRQDKDLIRQRDELNSSKTKLVGRRTDSTAKTFFRLYDGLYVLKNG